MQERARRLGLYPARQVTSVLQASETRRVVISPAPDANVDAYLEAIRTVVTGIEDAAESNELQDRG